MQIIILCICLIITASHDMGSWDTCHFGSVKCLCQEGQTKVNCSNRRLRTVPMFHSNVTWIDLSYNDIYWINNWFPSSVSYIDLSHNGIGRLYGHPFHGLYKLKTLNLERNRINNTYFYKGFFADLYSLTELNLKGNIPYYIPHGHISDKEFSDLRSLQTLKIDGPQSVTFGKGFENLKNLQKLDLSGMTGNCSFRKISKDMFLYTPRLVYLDVSACNILEIEEGAFGELKYLEHLDVSFNQHLGFWSLPNITHNLNKTSIKTFRAKGINCLTGMSGTILKRHLLYLKNTKISEINFEKNRLEYFELGLLTLLPNTLTTFSLGEITLAQGIYVIDYFFFQNRQFYNTSVQMRTIPYRTSYRYFHCQNEKYNPALWYFYFNWMEYDNQQCEASASTFISRRNEQHIITIDIPKSVKVFYANMRRLHRNIPELRLNASGLREIYMQDNILYTWDGPIHGIEKVEIANLSNNFCSHISKSFLKYARGLRILILSKNNIGRSLLNDVGGEIFRNTVSLEILDLSDNNIHALSVHMFQNMKKLQVLDLRHNQLSTVRVKMEHMKNIYFIDLKQNRLSSIETESRILFQRRFQISKFSIDLSENRLLCSCDNIDFIEWIAIHWNHFEGFKHYSCSSVSSYEFNFTSAEASITAMKDSCRSYIGTYIAIAVALLFIASIVIGIVLIKKFKWKNRNAATNMLKNQPLAL